MVLPSLALALGSLLLATEMRCSMAVAVKMPMQASADVIGNSFRTFMQVLPDALADTELGADLGTTVALNEFSGKQLRKSDSSVSKTTKTVEEHGPATLAEYCAGDTEEEQTMKLKKGQRVMVNWKKYGTYYPARVEHKHQDGTVDVHYDDNFGEKNVSPAATKPMKEDKEEDEEGSKPKQRDDAACEMLDFLKKTKTKLGNLDPMISQWLVAQRAKVAGQGLKPTTSVVVPPPAAAPPAAPAVAAPGAAPDAAASDKLEKLKRRLAEQDAEIKALRTQREQNSHTLKKAILTTGGAAPPSGMQTVDDLIAQYNTNIEEKDKEIQALKEDIVQQDQELASLGANQISLKDIDAAVQDLEEDAEEAQVKRDELEKNGTLDPDLRIIIDTLIKDIRAMRQKVDNLMALDAKAKVRKDEAERKAAMAVEAARAQATKDGKDPDEAGAKVAKHHRAEAERAAHEDALESLEAGHEVKTDLDEAEKGATELDTGLHPHGSKWWRHRYEHSYIEAMLMIFISCLMLFWSRVMHHVKHQVKVLALPEDAVPKTAIEEMDEEGIHGTFMVLWLTLLGEQMMVCILVFLTVWVLATTHLIDVFLLVVKPTADMHVPHTGEEYRQLSVDICTIFFFAILFYFCLMFPVASDARDLTRSLEHIHRGSEFEPLKPASARSAASGAVMGHIRSDLRTSTGLSRTQTHFRTHMREEMKAKNSPEMKEICHLLNDDISTFPLYKYLTLNVRTTASSLLQFSWTMWLPVVATFFCFMLLHRFVHLGYVRIMFCFVAALVLLVIAMAWYTKTMSKMLKLEDEDAEIELAGRHPITASMVLCAFQYSLFFLCYGVARMICQPWMWRLHFNAVLCLTFFTIVQAFVFVVIISPAIPSFCAVMALPPYIDSDNLAVMLHVAKGVKLTSMGS